jgi:DNA polymerase III alpha subunit
LDDRIDGFIEGYKNIQKADVAQFVFGVKLTVCSDMNIKDADSLGSESKVAIFVRNSDGYSDLIRLYNRAWTDGFYYQGRLDWATLNKFWTSNLELGLPYFSSFLARNTLTFNSITPDLPVAPWIFQEIGSELPFAPLIDEGINNYAQTGRGNIVKAKSIYYKDQKDFRTYQVFRAISERSTYASPRVNNLASDKFSWEHYKKLTA